MIASLERGIPLTVAIEGVRQPRRTVGHLSNTRRKQRSVKVDANVVVTDERRHVIDPRSLDEAGRAALRQLLAAAEAQGLIGPAQAGE